MLLLFMFAMIPFLAWRAFIYYNEEKVFACILAMIGCVFFTFGIYVDYQMKMNPRRQSETSLAKSPPTISAQSVAATRKPIELSYAEKRRFCEVTAIRRAHGTNHIANPKKIDCSEFTEESNANAAFNEDEPAFGEPTTPIE